MAAVAYAYKPQLRSSIGPIETHSRRNRRRRLKLAGTARKLVFCVLPLVMLLTYVGLMASLTAQTYRLNADQRVHATLFERNTTLRSHVAQLESVDRLEAVAKQLHMTEPSKVAFITTPAAPRPAVRAFAIFARILGVTRWFGVR